MTEQPPPTPNATAPIIDRVLVEVATCAEAPGLASSEAAAMLDLRADLRARAEVGRARYGVYLQAHNGRNAMRDAYEEAMDLVMYLRQAMEEGEPISALYLDAVRIAARLRRRRS